MAHADEPSEVDDPFAGVVADQAGGAIGTGRQSLVPDAPAPGGVLVRTRRTERAGLNPQSGPDKIFGSVTAPADRPKAEGWDVYLSGYAYHDRDTYTDNQLRKMNESTLGGGFGKTRRDEQGNERSLYVVRIRDSNERPQWMAGYAHQWIFPIVPERLEVGAGLTALLIRRHDWFEGRPFPALLPMASVGSRKAQLLATYVPRLSTRKAKGNIVFLMFKIAM